MTIKMTIIVIKITITVLMKITIVLKLMKIVAQSRNRKTYICSSSDNAQQEVSENVSPNITALSATQQGYQKQTFTHFLQHKDQRDP